MRGHRATAVLAAFLCVFILSGTEPPKPPPPSPEETCEAKLVGIVDDPNGHPDWQCIDLRSLFRLGIVEYPPMPVNFQ